MKANRGNDCEQGGSQEDDELRQFERRLGLQLLLLPFHAN
jgi:hypothetical protein